MNEAMPACATSPTAERRAGGMSAYHGSESSSRLIVAVARSPEIRRSQGTLDGDGLAIGGLILGWVSALLWVIGIAVIFLFLGGMAWLATLN